MVSFSSLIMTLSCIATVFVVLSISMLFSMLIFAKLFSIKLFDLFPNKLSKEDRGEQTERLKSLNIADMIIHLQNNFSLREMFSLGTILNLIFRWLKDDSKLPGKLAFFFMMFLYANYQGFFPNNPFSSQNIQESVNEIDKIIVSPISMTIANALGVVIGIIIALYIRAKHEAYKDIAMQRKNEIARIKQEREQDDEDDMDNDEDD